MERSVTGRTSRDRTQASVRGRRRTEGAAYGQGTGNDFRGPAQFCVDRVAWSITPPGTPWNNGYVESFNRRLRAECLDRNHWTACSRPGL
ncbi:integrase core domain-containing protein [Nocardia gamkensis]|uniref:integrase core domain-containing protein n=1 Tax=Nocardia gamkensis TaxID=352869 RepID=UPI0036EB2A9A